MMQLMGEHQKEWESITHAYQKRGFCYCLLMLGITWSDVIESLTKFYKQFISI